MLNKTLCELLSVDAYAEYLVNRLDYIDDLLEKVTNPLQYIKLLGEKEALLEAREKFYKHKEQRNKEK